MGMGGGGIGFTIGENSTKQTVNETYNTAKGSTIGSSQGSVNIAAGKDLSAKGASIVAGKDINLQGQNVTIEEAREDSYYRQTYDTKQTGLTVSLGGAVGSAINTASQTAYQAKHETNDRLSALKGIQSALTGYQAYQAVQQINQNTSTNSAVGINVSIGQQKTHSEQTQQTNTGTGSTLQATNNITVVATGDKANPKTGDITIKGSDLQAGNNIVLQANNDLNLLASDNTQSIRGENTSSGWSVGTGIGFGTTGSGINVNASVNKGKGKEKGDSQSWTETNITAGNKVSLSTGNDANLIGAQVSGKQIEANISNDLNLKTLQDSDNYKSSQQNTSIGGSYVMAGAGAGSLNVTHTQQKMDSTYKSTQEQTGIYAGEGGYQITVGKNTDLNGSVLASTADANKNKLNTGTLTWNDLENKAEYKVSSSTAGMNSGGSVGDLFLGNMANTLLVGANNSDKKESTTHAAVSDGNITIRDQANQTQDINTLNRDTEHANNGFSPIFDKEKEQNRLNEIKAIGELGSQISDVVRTQGEINAFEASNNAHPELKGDVDKLKDTDEYKNAMKDYGTGGTYQQVTQAVTAALQGLAGNNIGQAISGAASPYVAGIIKDMTEGNEPAHLMTHAVWGAIVANAKGGNAAAGAIGAATAEGLAPYIIDYLYPGKEIKDLTEEEKQKVVALATIGAGLAGSLGTNGDFSTGVAAAETGKNAVENNTLSPDQQENYKKQKEYFDQNCGAGNNSPECQTAMVVISTFDPHKDSVSQDIAEPGQVVDCVTSSSGKCIVTNEYKLVPDYRGDRYEWGIKPITEQDAIQANTAYNNSKLAGIYDKGCALSPILCAVNTTLNDKHPYTDDPYSLLDKGLAIFNAGAFLAGAGWSIREGKVGGNGTNAQTGNTATTKITTPSTNVTGGVANATGTIPTLDQLSQAATSANRNGLTDAGRALQKHGGRQGSVYTYTDQKASTLNKEAQHIVDDILATPGTKIEIRIVTENKQRIKVIEATAPDGRTLRFNEDGTKLIGFREPQVKR